MSLVMDIVWGRRCRHSGNGCWRLRLRACVCVYASLGPHNNPTAPWIHTHTTTHKNTGMYGVCLRGCKTWEQLNTMPSYQRPTFSGRKRGKKRCWEKRHLYSRKLSFSSCLFMGFPFPVKITDTLGDTKRACKYTLRSDMIKGLLHWYRHIIIAHYYHLPDRYFYWVRPFLQVFYIQFLY